MPLVCVVTMAFDRISQRGWRVGSARTVGYVPGWGDCLRFMLTQVAGRVGGHIHGVLLGEPDIIQSLGSCNRLAAGCGAPVSGR